MTSPNITATTAVRRSFVAPLLFFTALLLGLVPDGNAEPYQPADDQSVVLQIPAAERDGRTAVEAARAAFSAAPDSAQKAAELAGVYLDLHARLGDPRLLGYAESVLNQFKEASNDVYPPVALRLIHADILQARHKFSAASNELWAILAENPEQASAWLMLASIAETQGDYDVTRQACAQLLFAGYSNYGLTCSASVASLQGRSQAALDQLRDALSNERSADRDALAWTHVVAAEIALRAGLQSDAEALLHVAIQFSEDLYPRLALSDLLIDQARFQDAEFILDGMPATDAVLIRRAQIVRNSEKSDAGQRADRIAEQLLRRVAALHMRGDLTHGREEALIALRVTKNADRALEAATRNWALQRESIDAILLLEAAIAANRPDAASPVIDWMDRNNSDDLRLLNLRGQLRRVTS